MSALRFATTMMFPDPGVVGWRSKRVGTRCEADSEGIVFRWNGAHIPTKHGISPPVRRLCGN